MTGPEEEEASRREDAAGALELLELGDALLEVDRGWRVVRVNRRQEELSRRPRAQTLGRVLWELWPGSALSETPYRREYRRCMEERVPVRFEGWFEPLRMWTDVDAYPTSSGGIAIFLRDVTQRRRAEEALRESDRRKSEFLALLSHELRNPLAPIRNSVQVLGSADPASEQAGRARAIVARQVDHIARLVDDLLDVGRISTGKLRLSRAQLDLTVAIGEIVEDMRPLFASRGVALELRAPAEAVWVKGDRTRLAQVVTNLLHNASKFTDRGGRVTIALEADGGQARIAVRDDGAGVAPELLPQLFEPFVQSEATLHRTRAGLGLGLSLVRGIAQLHGGTATARSDGPGRGAEFVVTLPAAEPAPALVAEPGAVAEAAARRRVLVVEDSLDAADSLRDVLELFGGHEVHLATDGEAGVVAARQLRPDVVVCDVGLPVVDGFEVARRIRASEAAADARLIALSGYAAPEDVERALRAGFDYHLAKPPDLDRLLALVAAAPASGAPARVAGEIATGHHEVDAQHASILAEAARLRRAGPDAVWDSVRFLLRHTASHFAYEEALMEDVSYPGLAAHQERHREFVDELRRLRDRLEADGTTPENVAALATAVETWIAEHVLKADRFVAEFIRERSSAS